MIKTVEIIVRGDIIEKNIILKLGEKLKVSKLRADFSSSVVSSVAYPRLIFSDLHSKMQDQQTNDVDANGNEEDTHQTEHLSDICCYHRCHSAHYTPW